MSDKPMNTTEIQGTTGIVRIWPDGHGKWNWATPNGSQGCEPTWGDAEREALTTDAESALYRQANDICGCAFEDAPDGTLLEKLRWVRANCMGNGTDGELDASELDKLIAKATGS